LTAKGDGDRWLYREVAVIVARQNGKTTLLIPLIAQRLLAGQSIMHAAQNARLPREVHEEVVDLLREHYPKELAAKRSVSYAVGHEVIKLRSGGQYRIVAPTRSGARGTPTDLVIVDELREMEVPVERRYRPVCHP
jgi:phage terminase large subunit-like protein